ncbi:L-serine ammonia-lyase, iron-sulfur-dependent, subunit alpha [Gudongella sp. DL1XJH-153]|uniref:L-serine ammonia-lyase, iron-sulfur-dependent, subunit alpha n=1 Tax=Gudongella sp. DL1XJH-153 TaxID=3409804 RepID=UPI003BB7E9F8
MFKNVQELVQQAEDQNKKLYEIMIEQESVLTEKSREEVIERMDKQYQVMKNSALKGLEGVTSYSGMTGGDAKKMDEYIKKGDFLTNSTLLKAVSYAISINEVNASMGLICASPTAGSSGVLPAVVLALQEKLGMDDKMTMMHLFTAGAFGFVIANNAFISGAAGGCQAEIGSASAMAAAAAVEMAGGTPTQAAHAMALALKNMLGLTCDPLAGLVEVPCIKRNAAGASNAIMAAEMALAGIETKVPWDEVISAMYNIGLAMPVTLRETSLAGLAVTETGKMWKEKLL